MPLLENELESLALPSKGKYKTNPVEGTWLFRLNRHKEK